MIKSLIMIKAINNKTVMIQSFPMPKETTKLAKSETTMEEEMKKQNRGKVIMVGNDVDWPEVGQTVSYFRKASTDITDDDGKEYQLVNKVHCLAIFDTKTK